MGALAHLGFVSIPIADTSNASLDLDLDIELYDNENDTNRVYLDKLDERLTSLRFTGSAALPSNGKLTADATFKVAISGGTPVTVTEPLADPDGDGPRTGTSAT